MANDYISQVTLPNNVTYDFKDQHLKVYTGTCTTAAATLIKDVTVNGAFTLETGAVIFVTFSTTNTGAVASLKLRVNSTADADAKPIKHQYNATESNLPAVGYIRANQTYIFYYDGTNWVMITDYNTDGGQWYTRYYTIKAQTAITAVHIIGGTDSGFNMIDSGTAFDIRYPVLYAGSAINAGATGSNNYVFYYAINVRNSSNANITFTAYKSMYIKGTISGNTFTPISGGNPFVQDITAADDGYVYYYIGHAYSTTAMSFDTTAKKIYWYKDGAIREHGSGSGIKNITRSGTTFTATRDDGTTFTFTQQDSDTKSFTITANATDGLWDLTGTNGTNAVTYALAPYSAKQSAASFYTTATNPTLTTRLNYDGYLYATKLYSGGTEVSVTGHTHDYLPLAGGIMTGNIRRYYSSASTNPMLTLISNNQDIQFFNIGHGTAAAENTTANYYKLLYKGTNNTTNNYLQLIAAASTTTEKIAIQIDELGKVALPQMATGGAKTPIYINSSGVFTAGDALKNLAYKDSLAASDIPNLDASKITSGTLTTARLSGDVLKWQTTTAASSALYDFGIYVNMNNAAGTSMNGGNYFNILNVPYRKASGNTKADWGWQIGNTTSNNGRLWYRTTGDGVFGDWQTIAHATQSTNNIGSATQPVYMTADGVITAGNAIKALGYKDTLAWNEIAQSGANNINEGTSDITDNTELFTSYASNNGFADTNAVGKVYRRDAIHIYNYIKGKLPAATTSALGLVTVGSGISVANGEISVTAANLGLSTAMHFIGVATVAITDGGTQNPTISGYDFTNGKKAGDVIIDKDSSREYVWSTTGKWELLGGDSSYKTTQTAISAPTAVTNKWASSIGQNANGVISVSYSELNTSGTWTGNAGALVSTASIGSSSTTHATALQAYFDANKATVKRGQLINFYDASSGNGSATFGYFLSGYDTNPYGGFFSAHYDAAYYIGIQGGTYTQHQILFRDNVVDNLTSSTSTNLPLSAKQGYNLANGSARDSTKLPLAGGTMTGVLTMKGNSYADAYDGALNMNNSNIYGLNSIYTADASDTAAEGIHFYRDTTHVDTLWMNGGALLFVPNRALGTSTTRANSQKILRGPASITNGYVFAADSTDGLTKQIQATNANTASTIVQRDASGNFSAGTITATLSGNATNVTGTVAIAHGGTGQTTLTGARAQLSGPEFIVGTWTATSGTWTGVTTDSELYDGKQIILYMPFAGSGNATLNLTLSGGGTTGAKDVYFESTTRFTIHKGQNSQLHLIYHKALKLSNGTTYEGWWYVANRDTTTTNATQIRLNGGVKAGAAALVAANIIVADSSGLYKHLKTGTAFDISYPILYLSDACAANATTTAVYSEINFTVTTTQSITLTAYKEVFIKGTLAGNLFTPVSAAPLTQTLPTTDDGYVYIDLGLAYSTTAIRLKAFNPIYWYKNGAFQLYTGNHIHGNIQNGGTLQTTDITIASGDKLVVTDNSDSNKIARASISFDGSTATKALTQKGTWETFNNYSLPVAASGTRGGIKIGYTASGKNYPVQLSNEQAYVNVPWTDTNNATTHTLDTTTKYYVTGTTSATTSTAGDTFDTGIYATTVAGEFSAVRHSLNVAGTEKAYIAYNSTDNCIDFIFV